MSNDFKEEPIYEPIYVPMNEYKLTGSHWANTNDKVDVIMSAWHKYCMESLIFRIFVKLGLRK